MSNNLTEQQLKVMLTWMTAAAQHSYSKAKSELDCGFILDVAGPLPAITIFAPKDSAFARPVKSAVRTAEGLERLAQGVRAKTQETETFLAAGVICTMNVSVDGTPPEPSVLLYVDQRYGGTRVLLAPLRGDTLVFRDFGTAHPLITFLPHLFSVASYHHIAEA